MNTTTVIMFIPLLTIGDYFISSMGYVTVYTCTALYLILGNSSSTLTICKTKLCSDKSIVKVIPGSSTKLRVRILTLVTCGYSDQSTDKRLSWTLIDWLIDWSFQARSELQLHFSFICSCFPLLEVPLLTFRFLCCWSCWAEDAEVLFVWGHSRHHLAHWI